MYGLFLICCGIFVFCVQYLSHYFVAKIFNYKPVFYYKKDLSLISITFWAKPFNITKILFLFTIGPMIEICFILIGIFFQIPAIKWAGVLSLLTDVYIFKKIYDLFRLKKHHEHFDEYFGM